MIAVLTTAASSAQTSTITPEAQKAIRKGNQAWINGMKKGDASMIASASADDAVDCSPEGDCARGKAAIAQHLKLRISKFAQAESASVISTGSVQNGQFVYEWGHADATLSNGERFGGRYLTVWRRQLDRSWEIFRNMPIPNDRPG